MAAERPERLYFIGDLLGDGRPVEWLGGIPARDLDPDDLARLSDEQLDRAMESGLYQKSEPTGDRAEARQAIRDAVAAAARALEAEATAATALGAALAETPAVTEPTTPQTTEPTTDGPPTSGKGRRTPGSEE